MQLNECLFSRRSIRLRHVAGSDWGVKRYMNMNHLLEMDLEQDALVG